MKYMGNRAGGQVEKGREGFQVSNHSSGEQRNPGERKTSKRCDYTEKKLTGGEVSKYPADLSWG